ncbi:DUF6787 family protein [Xanthocytophaga agilis]|uniref:DUF6787 domain-containing protein n=1 Tax=Xanthocytophaga agilis TaxID=3048010 RepID=A0AAE3UIM1_9BACT|nr:DUF6787 family protein [Xanthocytophaga agilis]MDJ1505561.1 hypothetical protein [Xanthocytophaga agilis]
MSSFLQKLQTRWGVHTIWQVIVILIVFALTGFTAMYIKKPIFAWLGITPSTSWWYRTLIWLVTVLPAYQIFLLFYGFILGQFTFFWNFEKRMFGRIGKLFGR